MSSRIRAILPGSRRALCSSSIARFSIERLLSAVGCDDWPVEAICGDSQIIRKQSGDVNESASTCIRGSKIEDRRLRIGEDQRAIFYPRSSIFNFLYSSWILEPSRGLAGPWSE